MSEKIDVLEVIDGPSIEELYTLELPIIKDDEQADSENERILKRSQLYWKDYLAEKNYNKDINKMCTICREDQIKAHGKITIPCKGLADISSKYSAEEVKYLEEEVYSKEDMEHIRTIYDPYAFVEKYLDADNIGSPDRRFSPRWYQEMVTKCTAKDKNIRMGRRCIPYYEKVLTKDGYKEISSLSVGTKVKSFNSKTKSFRYSEVTKVINNGVKKVYKLTLKNGKTIECTSNHPILTKYKKGMMWLTLDSGLFIGNKVCYNKRNKVFTSELVDIEYVGEVLTYDISVGEDHTFLVDDIITHNTGKSFALSIVIVHRAVTTTIVGYRILLVSPFKTQTDEVIDNIKGLCQLLGDNPLKSSKASPNHELIFNSGCILKGFTASKEANSIRGQPGHLLVIDEADDMPIKALISILGIRMGQPNVEVWMSGTPKGEKNLFAGDMKPETKSFHYPSFVIPHYDDAMDNNNRSDLGEVGYTQEVCLSGDTLVKTDKGDKFIKDMTTDDKVYDKYRNLQSVWQAPRITGIKPVYRYKTDDPAVYVDCTPDHKFPNANGDKIEIQYLKSLEVVEQNMFYGDKKDEILARLVGFNLGDGTVASTRLSTYFYSSKKEDLEPLLADVKTLYPEYKGSVNHSITKGKDTSRCLSLKPCDRFTVECSTKITKDFLLYGMIRGKKVEQLFDVPSFVKEGTSQVKAEFFAALFGAEGTLSIEKNGDLKNPSLIMTKKNKDFGIIFFDSLVVLLQELGINSTYSTHEVNSTIRGINHNTNTFTLRISRELDNCIKFLKVVGVRYNKEKEFKCLRLISYLEKRRDILKQAEDRRLNILLDHSRGFSSKELRIKYTCSKSVVEKYISRNSPIERIPRDMKYLLPNIFEIISRNAIRMPITSVEYLGTREVYNLGVNTSDTSYILSNGIRVFNCAEYGAVANGVYQDDFLRIAQEREVWITSKDVLTRRSNFIVIIGIDWNGDGVGVRILTVAYDKTRNDFKIVERTEVSLVGRTQDEAVNEVVKANRKYNADHIYGDVGYGHYQLETLKVYGERAFKTTKPGDPDRKLINVVGVEFGKTTDITDHNSGEVYKVPTKQFAVQNSVLLLEKNMIGLHPKEDHAMILQMKNYIEKSRNKGRIVYTTISKKIGDHDLDALIFALYGFKIEYPTIFGKHSMQAMMRFGDRFNPTADPSLLDDIPFVSLSFGGNYVPRHRNNKVRGSRPERVQNIGTIRRRNSFR